MGRRIAFSLALLLLAGLAVAAWQGAFEGLDRKRVVELVEAAGPWAPIGFVLAFALLEPFGAPGALFAIPASWIWPFPIAFGLSWLGAIGAGVVGFWFARTIGHRFVQRHLPDRFRRYDERLETRGLVTVVVVRLVFFLAPPAHWLLGLSRVRFGTFLLGTAVGFAPGMALLVLFGDGLYRALAGTPPGVTVAVLALVVLIAALVRTRRARLRRD